MYIRQRDLFWGRDRNFVKKATDLAVNVSCRAGDRLFAAGDAADHFYILLRGAVTLEGNVDGQKSYRAKEPGEIIGWSALIQRRNYTASATCVGEAELLKVERKPFMDTVAEAPGVRNALFERLAKMLGNSLLEMYPAAA